MQRVLSGIFLDTGNIGSISRYHALGIIRGVTTNPTILVKDGVTGGWAGIERRSKEIARLIDSLPLSVEVTTNEPKKMLEQAREMAGWAKNINVKITTAPTGAPKTWPWCTSWKPSTTSGST